MPFECKKILVQSKVKRTFSKQYIICGITYHQLIELSRIKIDRRHENYTKAVHNLIKDQLKSSLKLMKIISLRLREVESEDND